MGFEIVHLRPNRAHLYGASDAQRDMSGVVAQLAALPHRGDVIFDLRLNEAESVSGSYIRATLLWALLCGQADAKQTPSASRSDPWAVRPLPLFPIVSGCSGDISEEVHDFFAQRNLPLLQVTDVPQPIPEKATILGKLDRFLLSTLLLLAELGGATAADLAAASAEQITVNGWSNRLADLFALRLVSRQRSGKYWIYSPLAKNFTLWD